MNFLFSVLHQLFDLRMWNGYLKPSFNRKSWTEEEEDRLLSLVSRHKAQSWDEIGREMENRSAYQCFVHYRSDLSLRTDEKYSRWTKEEDDLLLKLKEELSIGSMIPWTRITAKMPGRSKSQIYHRLVQFSSHFSIVSRPPSCRYNFTLNPDINRTHFTIEEDCILMAAVKEYGQSFQNFPSNLLPGRTTVQIRNRYNNVLRHVGQRDHWLLEHDKRLMELVAEYGESDWAKVAQQLGCHNRTSCRSRYTTIKRFLEKNPSSTVESVPRRKRAFSTNVTADNWTETIIKEKHSDFGVAGASTVSRSAERRTFAGIVKTPLGREYYNYFRFAYNFVYGQKYVAPQDFQKRLSAVGKALNVSSLEQCFRLTTKSDYVCLSEVQTHDRPADLKISTNFAFPVNYNTLVGLRSLTILFESEEKQIVKTEEKSTTSSHPALKIFRQRFRAVFQNAMLLAKAERSNEHRLRVKPQREPVLPRRFHAGTTANVDAAEVNETIFIVNEEADLMSTGEEAMSSGMSEWAPPEPNFGVILDYELSTGNGNFQVKVYDANSEPSNASEAGPSGIKRPKRRNSNESPAKKQKLFK